MLIGVLSDTHNDLDGIKKAVKIFNLRNAGLVLHCGDICFPSYAAEFSQLKCPFKAVFGNNDVCQTDLKNIISPFGTIKKEPFFFVVENKHFIICHHLNALPADCNKYGYALYGHTHQSKILKTDKTIFLNPGEACGRRYGKKSAAFIDLDNNTEEIIDL